MRTLLAVARTQHISLIIYEACAVGVAGLLIGATYTVRQQFTCPDSERRRWKEWSGEWGRFQSTFTSLDRPLVQLSTRPLGMPGEDKRGPPF